MYYILLDDFSLAVDIRHRLGLSLLGLLEPGHLSRCGPRCKRITDAAPLSASHPSLGYTWPHAYHQLSCGCDRHRIARHEALLKVVSATLAAEGGYTWELKRHLGSSVYRRSKVDLLLTSFTADPPTTALDITISCPFLPSYISACAPSPRLASFPNGPARRSVTTSPAQATHKAGRD